MTDTGSASKWSSAFVLICAACFGLVLARAQQPPSKASTLRRQATQPASSDLIQPEELATILKARKSDKPLILQVGSHVLYVQAHIPGSEYIGPSSSPEALAGCRKTTARLNMLSRFRDFRDKGRVLVAPLRPADPFPAQLGVDLRRLNRQIPHTD